MRFRLLLGALCAAFFMSGCVVAPADRYHDRGYYGDRGQHGGYDCRGRDCDGYEHH
jgi:hypothetical protein